MLHVAHIVGIDKNKQHHVIFSQSSENTYIVMIHLQLKSHTKSLNIIITIHHQFESTIVIITPKNQ